MIWKDTSEVILFVFRENAKQIFRSCSIKQNRKNISFYNGHVCKFLSTPDQMTIVSKIQKVQVKSGYT